MPCIEVCRDGLSFLAPLREGVTSVGRSLRCDISLPDVEISRTHFTLLNQKGQISLIDKSIHGTSVNGQPVTKIDLTPGDEIQISQWTLKLRFDVSTHDETQIKARGESTGVLSHGGKDEVLTLNEAVLTQLEPISRVFHIKKNLFTLGKNDSNDVILNDEFISNYHCKIEFRNSKFFLKDLQSTNGTILNQNRIVGAFLSDQSVIEIGKARFLFRVQQKNKSVATENETDFFGMVSNHVSMKEIFGLIRTLRLTTSAVLIQGETGTGKELVARAIHENSFRKSGKFVSVNCGAIAKELIESELFGHEKGSFTGATGQRDGLFEQAHGGTLFLDEIGELPLDLQPKLLRVLETGEIRRVGSSRNIQVDVRIIAATHKNLNEEVAQNRFREDLYYRIYVLPVTLPALRNRKSDIEKLVGHFLRNAKNIHSEAKTKLVSHDWPGNVRELKNVIERAQILSANHDEILSEHIRFATNRPLPVQPLPITLEEIEKLAIFDALNKNEWKKRDTAKNLGIAKSTLHEKVKRYGIVREKT